MLGANCNRFTFGDTSKPWVHFSNCRLSGVPRKGGRRCAQMSFVSRMRTVVRRGNSRCARSCDEFASIDGSRSAFGRSMQNLLPGKVELDESELDGAGARAIFEPDGNILLAKFIGCNRDFCKLFGYESSDLQTSTLKLLSGPLTDIRYLQEIWTDVRKGSDKVAACNLYSKSGEMLCTRIEFLLRNAEQLNHSVLVMRVCVAQEPPNRPHTVEGLQRPRLAFQRSKATLLPSPRTPEAEVEQLLKRMEDVVPKATLDRLRKSMEGLIPKAKLDAAEAEIVRLQKIILDKSAPKSEFDRLKEQVESLSKGADAETSESIAFAKVRDEQLTELQNQLSEAHAEIDRLKRQLEEMECKLSEATTQRAQEKEEAAQNLLEERSRASSAESDSARNVKSRRASCALREVFPRSVAEAIMDGRTLEPIHKECVSVFFSDIVGFTTLSSSMTPAKVSSLLNRLFNKFDALAQLHGVQKVDVIGDAYLAAANILEDQRDDHSARVARFAVDAMTAARATRLDEDDPASPAGVQVRIGIHCGPVSASVVGSQGFKYTLIGDTVNTASRMESTSLPGQIQCSEAAAALLGQQAPDVLLRPRLGGVEVKGKGHMQTYWISQEPAAPAQCRARRLVASGSFGRRKLLPIPADGRDTAAGLIETPPAAAAGDAAAPAGDAAAPAGDAAAPAGGVGGRREPVVCGIGGGNGAMLGGGAAGGGNLMVRTVAGGGSGGGGGGGMVKGLPARPPTVGADGRLRNGREGFVFRSLVTASH